MLRQQHAHSSTAACLTRDMRTNVVKLSPQDAGIGPVNLHASR